MLTDDPRSIAGALSGALLLQLLEGSSATTACGAFVAMDFSQTVKSITEPATSDTPAFFVGDVGGTSVIAIAGTSTLLQGSLLVESYVNGITDLPTDPNNLYLKSVASTIFNTMRAAQVGAQQNVEIVGHSLGGAVAVVLAQVLGQLATGQAVRIRSYGAPKPGGQSVMRVASGLKIGRWMCTDDPVPLVMPTIGDDIALALIYGALSLVRVEYFLQPWGGLNIDPGGNITSGVFPSTAVLDPITEIAAWMLSLYTFAGSPHNISAYVDRLTLAKNGAGVKDTTPERVGTHSVAESPHSGAISAIARAARRALSAQEATQNLGGGRPTIPEDWIPVVRRIGGIYTVEAGGAVLTLSTRKTSARAIAGSLRQFLYHVQRAGLVEVDGLQKWVDGYLQAAQEGSAGFTPTLKTQLNVGR